MQAKSDAQLLREYAHDGSEAAFAEIVARYTGLIYSAVLRKTGSPDLAGDAAQSVFTDLARKAPRLSARLHEHGTLVGWLYRATHYAIAKYLRDEHRRHIRERQAMPDFAPASETSPDWERVRPVLDDAMDGLDETDRQAMLLRFFQNEGFQSIGAALGISDDAAQKRVSRALEKLRARLARHGITTPAAMLASVLSSNAIQTPPAGLAAKLAAASLAGNAATSGGALTLMKTLAITPLKIGIISAGITASLAVWLAAEHKALDNLQRENAALRGQISRFTPVRASQPEPAPLKVDSDELVKLRREHSELLRLRGEVGRLRDRPQAAPSSMSAADQAELALLRGEAQARGLNAASINALKQLGVAVRLWEANNEDGHVLPTRLDQMKNELSGYTALGYLGTNGVEFFDYGQPLPDTADPYYLLARETQPRLLPDGSWQRAYLCVDGSVQTAGSPDGNFDPWEKQWFTQFGKLAARNDRASH